MHAIKSKSVFFAHHSVAIIFSFTPQFFLIPSTTTNKAWIFVQTEWVYCYIAYLGRLLRVDLIKWVSNVCPPVHLSVRPQKVSLILMKFGM